MQSRRFERERNAALIRCFHVREKKASAMKQNEESKQVPYSGNDPVSVSLRWPSTLWLVRHGQSAGNVARDMAMEKGALRIELSGRDVDVPLSELGREQARALGRWFAKSGDRPVVVFSSPYVRAVETAALFREAGGCDRALFPRIDERLREKEFGILDGLTVAGIRQMYPEQANLRETLGKFYHRPPGGESWVDVIFRLRALMDSVALHHAGRPVMIVAHQVVVLCLRYIIENLSEAEILAIDREGDIANCAVTQYRYDEAHGPHGGLRLVHYNIVAPMEDDQTPVTAAPDRMVAARG